jgi:hypothetical protein
MPECKSLLEKEVRYKEKYWFVRINDNLIEIYDSKEKDKTVGHQLYAGIINDSDLISETKKAIKQAYIITCQTNKYEDFKNWDGNMDNELPEIQP